MKLTKTKTDEKKEANDLANDATLIFLANIHAYKFNVGDILIKKRQDWDDDGEKRIWEIERDSVGAPVKYVYAFENSLGIGYIKKLKNDGKGPTRAQPVCITKFIQNHDQLILDPEYAEHLLLSQGEEFKYNAQHERFKAFREQAITKNKAMAVRTTDEVDTDHPDWNGEDGDISKEFDAFWKVLKVGDTVYVSDYQEIDNLGDSVYEIIKKTKNGHVRFRVVKDDIDYNDPGYEFTSTKREASESWIWICAQRPYPLTEDNI